jgi:hypothetical protein
MTPISIKILTRSKTISVMTSVSEFMNLPHSDMCERAPPVVFVDTDADASGPDEAGNECEGISLTMSLIGTTEADANGPTHFATLLISEKRTTPQQSQPLPENCTDAQKEQMQEILEHFCKEVKRELPQADIIALSLYEQVIPCSSGCIHLLIFWDDL